MATRVTFKRIQEEFSKQGYNIDKHTTKNQYIVNKFADKKIVLLEIKGTLTEVYEIYTAMTIINFIKKYKIKDLVLDNNVKAKKSKVNNLADEEVSDEITATNYDIIMPKSIKIDSNKEFYFPSYISNIVTRMKMNENVFLTGPTGCGKTEMTKALGKVFGQKIIRMNFAVGTTEAHIIGRMLVEGGATVFNYGLLPLAMKNGWWICFDEIDYAEPEHLAILQPILEGEPLIITQNKSEEIIAHSNFRIFATANTKGRGDETQSYTGTNVLNLAFLDRFSIFEMEYTKQEKSIITSVIKDSILTKQIMDFFKLLRSAAGSQAQELVNAAFSTRRLIQFAKVLAASEPLEDAIYFELLMRFEESEQPIVTELANDIWDKEHYLKGWKLGDSHIIEEKSFPDEATQVTADKSSEVIPAKGANYPF